MSYDEQPGVLSPAPRLRADIVFTLLLLGVAYICYLARDVILLIYVSALFAVVLSPAIGVVRRIKIGRWRPGRGAAFIIIVALLVASITMFLIFAVPPIVNDASKLGQDMPTVLEKMAQKIRQVPMLESFDVRSLQQYLATAAGGALGLVKGIAGGFFALFTFIILVAYFIVDGYNVFIWVINMVPFEHRKRLSSTLQRAEGRVRHWLVGQAALMAILGVSSTLVFGLAHVRYFYALGVFAGLANIVPIVGPMTSFILSVAVASFDSWQKVVIVIIFYAVYQQIEQGYLVPKIMKASVDLAPLGVIIALMMGGSLAGVVGALVAVPTAAVIAVAIDEYLVKPNAPPPDEYDTMGVREW
jgi:predicted PurR-regulated permease PerM